MPVLVEGGLAMESDPQSGSELEGSLGGPLVDLLEGSSEDPLVDLLEGSSGDPLVDLLEGSSGAPLAKPSLGGTSNRPDQGCPHTLDNQIPQEARWCNPRDH